MTASYFVPRDEEWQPQTPEEKLDLLQSTQQIKQLPMRYGLAVDSRNIDALMELFVPDVQVGKDLRGRAELEKWYRKALSSIQRTIHLVGNHILSFSDADHATGVVYCRDEVESDGVWTLGHIQYWDTYERQEGRWYFVRRRYTRWKVVDKVVRTTSGGESADLSAQELPNAWPTWNEFWH